jgi:glycosyltransferase involved in cell wall biosynthesis
MAGPAIRTLELARSLAADSRVGPVTVASLAAVEITDPAVRLVAAADGEALDLLTSDVGSVVVQGDVLGLRPELAFSDLPIVVDAYDPFHLEQLERTRGLPEAARRAIVRDCITSLNRQLSRADFVLCASSRQRALWLGHLAALGRVNSLTYDRSRELSDLIAVVPFGTPQRRPEQGDRSRVTATFPAITDQDVLVVWGGGIYEWLDAESLVRAVAAAGEEVPGLKLLFLGTRHPVPGVESAGAAARAAAVECGVLDRSVFFHEGWLPYEDRDRWLGAADIAATTHLNHLETEFAYRTRVLDYFWCGLPVVSSSGDELADVVVGAEAGVVVAPGDVAAIRDALVHLARDEGARRRAAAASADLGRSMTWDAVSRPLADFCAEPRRAPDLVLSAAERAQLGLFDPNAQRGTLLRRLRVALADGGPALVGRRLTARVERALRRP